MKDRDDVRDDRDDLDDRRENGANGIGHKSSYSQYIRSVKPKTNSRSRPRPRISTASPRRARHRRVNDEFIANGIRGQNGKEVS